MTANKKHLGTEELTKCIIHGSLRKLFTKMLLMKKKIKIRRKPSIYKKKIREYKKQQRAVKYV